MRLNFSEEKLPIITLITSAVMILLLFLPLVILFMKGPGALSWVMSNSSPDDAISGWAVFPAFLVDLFSVIGSVIVIIVAVIYYAVIALTIGWNVMFTHVIKNESSGRVILCELPAVLFSIFATKEIVTLAVKMKCMILVLYLAPVIALMAFVVIQVFLFWKKQIQ